MNNQFQEFINDTKLKLKVYEMDYFAFDDFYDDEDREMMNRLRKALYPENNEELSKSLSSKCFITATDKITYNVFGKGKENDLYSIDKWLSQEAELTADEMFEELGYKKSSDLHYFGYVYDKKDGDYVDRIVIEKTNYGFYYIKHRISYTKYFYDEYIRSRTITEEEDKAIHKKIEELKRG